MMCNNDHEILRLSQVSRSYEKFSNFYSFNQVKEAKTDELLKSFLGVRALHRHTIFML